MGVLAQIRSICNRIIERSYSVGQLHGEKKKIKNSERQRIISEVSLTEVQKAKIEDFYQKYYGKKIDVNWHRLYQSFTGNFDETYLPEYIFSSEIEPKWNSRMYRDALSDKNLLYIYTVGMDGVRIPKIYASRVNGLIRDENMVPTDREHIIQLLSNIGETVIKPTVDSGSGKNVRFLNIVNGIDAGNGEPLGDIIDSFPDDFNIQECIINHSSLQKLNDSSVNTFRIVTYIWDGQIYHMPIALRIGQGGNRLDNAHAGGMFVGISDEGKLGEYAYTEFKDTFSQHPDTGTVFKDCKIELVPQILKAAYKMHARVPQLKVMSWDLTLDQDGTVVLIEVNTVGQTVWFPQMANGKSAFGNNTADILNSLR